MRYRWFRRYPENSFILTETINVHATCVLSERPTKAQETYKYRLRLLSVIIVRPTLLVVVIGETWRGASCRRRDLFRGWHGRRPADRKTGYRRQGHTPAVGLAAFTVWCKEIYCGFFPVRSSKFPINKTRVEIMDRVAVFGFVVTMRKTNALTENYTSFRQKTSRIFFFCSPPPYDRE